MRTVKSVCRPRTVYEVAEVISRRYGSVGQSLLEVYLDHSALFTMGTLIDQGGMDPDEEARLRDLFSGIDLERASVGAYEYFCTLASEHHIEGPRLFSQLCEAEGYWGTDDTTWQTEERAATVASSYLPEVSHAG